MLPLSCRHTYREVAMLGKGEFGQVAAAVHLLDGSESAVKMTAAGAQLDDAQAKRALLEAQVSRLVATECPAALHWHGSWVESMAYKNETTYRFFLRMELCGDSLAMMKKRRHSFSEEELTCILRQVRASS
jgi:serine/threonine protein kinase